MCLALGLLACASGGAGAQTASEITPRTFEPNLQTRGGGIVIPQGMGPEAPAGAERLFVRISGVRIEGGLPALSAQEQKIIAGLTGRRVSAAELFAAARELEKAYATAGYALVRVVLPVQTLNDGATLRLSVIDGFIERVDTAGLPDNIRARIASMLAPLVGRRGLTMVEMERKLLLAGDTPGTVLRSALAGGSQPGASVLVVEARYKPLTGSASFDNSMTTALGSYNLSLGAELNSITGHGELAYFRAGGAPWAGESAAYFDEYPRNRSLAAGLTLPIGLDGLTLNFEGTDSRATPIVGPTGLGTSSEFQRFSTRLRYPVMRARDLTVNLNGAFDFQNESVLVIEPLFQQLSMDRLRIARAGSDFVWFVPTAFAGVPLSGGLLTGGLLASFGIDGLGARDAPRPGSILAPLSRDGVSPEFQKLEVWLALNQPFAEHLALDLRGRAQTGFNTPLPQSEQFELAGPQGLSTFDTGQLQGDSGFVIRSELQFPFSIPVPLPFTWPSVPAQQGAGAPEGGPSTGGVLLTPYGFGAYGIAWLARPTVLEPGSYVAGAYGMGVRIGAAPQASFSAASLSFEYGRYQGSAGYGSGDRFTFSTSFQF
ncbi:ShlB/FhaC/HecB family hemolysin secretion/activation protein [Xanthobacteraceae bacterium A53D]